MPTDESAQILREAAKKFSVPLDLLKELITEEHLRLYQLRKRYISEDIDVIFEKYANRS